MTENAFAGLEHLPRSPMTPEEREQIEAMHEQEAEERARQEKLGPFKRMGVKESNGCAAFLKGLLRYYKRNLPSKEARERQEHLRERLLTSGEEVPIVILTPDNPFAEEDSSSVPAGVEPVVGMRMEWRGRWRTVQFSQVQGDALEHPTKLVRPPHFFLITD